MPGAFITKKARGSTIQKIPTLDYDLPDFSIIRYDIKDF